MKNIQIIVPREREIKKKIPQFQESSTAGSSIIYLPNAEAYKIKEHPTCQPNLEHTQEALSRINGAKMSQLNHSSVFIIIFKH